MGKRIIAIVIGCASDLMITNILIPTDGSEPSERAAKFAIELARSSDGKVHALYVADTSFLRSDRAMPPFEDVRSDLMDEISRGYASLALKEGEIVTQSIEDMARDAGVPCTKMVIEGYPANEILRVAADMDVIIMGRTGRTGSGVVMGGVAGRVVQNSKVPVLSVPGDGFAGSYDFRLNKILIATDGSQPSQNAAAFGVRLARLSKGKVLALYVAEINKIVSAIESSLCFDDISPELVDKVSIGLKEFALKAGESATKSIEGMAKGSGVPCTMKVTEGYPAAEIASVAKEESADVVVMGNIGKTGSEDIFLGGVTGKVIRNYSLPVLVVPGTRQK